MGQKVSNSNKTNNTNKPSRISRSLRKNIVNGMAHVHSSFNNTIVTMTDMLGKTISWSTCGKMGFKGSRKSTPYAAQVTAEDAVKRAMEHGLKSIDIEVCGPGVGRESAVRGLHAEGITVTSIRDVSSIPFNGVRPSKRRRV